MTSQSPFASRVVCTTVPNPLGAVKLVAKLPVTTGVCASAPLLNDAQKSSSVSAYAESRRSDVSDLVVMTFLPRYSYIPEAFVLQLPEIVCLIPGAVLPPVTQVIGSSNPA